LVLLDCSSALSDLVSSFFAFAFPFDRDRFLLCLSRLPPAEHQGPPTILTAAFIEQFSYTFSVLLARY